MTLPSAGLIRLLVGVLLALLLPLGVLGLFDSFNADEMRRTRSVRTGVGTLSRSALGLALCLLSLAFVASSPASARTIENQLHYACTSDAPGFAYDCAFDDATGLVAPATVSNPVVAGPIGAALPVSRVFGPGYDSAPSGPGG